MSPHFITDHFLYLCPNPRDYKINLRGRKMFRRTEKAFILHQIINILFLIFCISCELLKNWTDPVQPVTMARDPVQSLWLVITITGHKDWETLI